MLGGDFDISAGSGRGTDSTFVLFFLGGRRNDLLFESVRESGRVRLFVCRSILALFLQDILRV